MGSLYAVSRESFLILRREKIVIPMLVSVVIIFFLTTFISEWSITEDRAILYFNITHTSLRFIGGLIAILFGTKMLHDSHISGSLETILSRPIHKVTFLIGSFIALFFALILFGLLAGMSWYGINYLEDARVPGDFIYWGVILCVVEWTLLAAIGYALSSVCRFEMSLLASIMLWVIGLLSGAMSTSLENIQRYSEILPFVKSVAKYWSLDRFSLIDKSRSFHVEQMDLWNSVGYGMACVLFLLVLGSSLFYSEDVIR